MVPQAPAGDDTGSSQGCTVKRQLSFQWIKSFWNLDPIAREVVPRPLLRPQRRQAVHSPLYCRFECEIREEQDGQ